MRICSEIQKAEKEPLLLELSTLRRGIAESLPTMFVWLILFILFFFSLSCFQPNQTNQPNQPDKPDKLDKLDKPDKEICFC